MGQSYTRNSDGAGAKIVEEHISLWKTEEQAPFAGWDFSHLRGRMFEESPPWSYIQRAGLLLEEARSALDLGTGGGERLLDMQAQWPPVLIATEEYPPNVYLSAKRLAPGGASVVATRSTETYPLPFMHGAFDVVLNRHSAFNSAEVARVLASKGVFYTQQVHGEFAADLLAEFGAVPQWSDASPSRYVPKLEAAGLGIFDVAEWSGRLEFADVAAIVYYLKSVPWLVPGFSVDTHLDALMRLQAQLDRGQPLVFLSRKYVIEAGW